MAVKADDLYTYYLAELARLFIDIQSGKHAPYIGAVVAVDKRYWVKGERYSGAAERQRLSRRYKPYAYAVEGKRLRTMWTTRSYSCWSEDYARHVVQQKLQELGGVMFQGTLRNSLHNMPLSVMAAGLNEINIPGPSF